MIAWLLIIIGALSIVAFFLLSLRAEWTTWVFSFAILIIVSLLVWLSTIFDQDTVFYSFCGIGLVFAAIVAYLQANHPPTREARQKYLAEKRRRQRPHKKI